MALGVIAFLGQNFGNFTIKIDPSLRAALALGQSLTSTYNGDIQKNTSYLDLSGVGNISCTSADMVPTGEYLDADVDEENEANKNAAIAKEAKALDIGSDEVKNYHLNFLYFTFYLKNMSKSSVEYMATLATTNIREPDNVGVSCTLESLLRVRVYKNLYRDAGKFYTGALATHDVKTYALPTDENYTQENIRELGEHEESTRPDNDGLATNFAKPTEEQSRQKNFTVFNETDTLASSSIVRYTIVFWLEGSDVDTTRPNVEEQPKGGAITMGMSFGAVVTDSEES